MLYFAYTDWIFFLTAISQRNVSHLLLTLGYFLLIFYVFQKSLRNTGFDKHFEGRKNLDCSLRVMTTFWCGETAIGKIDSFDFHWYG